MKRLLQYKLGNRRGLTLVELLATVLILLLATSIAATGIPSAKAAYDKAVDASNAQVLLSITVTRLREELGLASDVSDGYKGSTVIYTSGKNGGKSEIKVMDDIAGISRIFIQECQELKKDDGSYVMDAVPLASIGNDERDKKLHVIFEEKGDLKPIEYSDGIFTIRNIKVLKDSHELAHLDTLTIRTINE